MDGSMRRILYYESVLEFKESSDTPLRLTDVNNWELCCTCLKEPDPEITKICVIGINGNYLSIKEMLRVILNEEHDFQDGDGDPDRFRFCRECLNKITSLYFFKNQIRRARSVLNRLKEKLSGGGQNLELIKHYDTTVDSSTMLNECSSSCSASVSTSIPIEVTEEITIVEYVNKAAEDVVRTNETLAEDRVDILNVDVEEFLDGQLSEDGEVNSETMEYFEEHELIDNIELNEEEGSKEEHEDNEDSDSNKVKTEEFLYENVEPCSQSKPPGRKSKIAKLLLESNKCDLCEVEFAMQRNLVQHVREHHPNTRAFRCVYCSKRFGHLQSLSRHIQTHRPDPKRICCEQCGRCFKRNDDLKRHMRIHTGERPYRCSVCGKSFKQHSELNSHKQVHFPVKKYECEICGHALHSRNGMYVHKKTHIGVQKHKCLYCSKEYLTNEELKSHMSFHIEKKFHKDSKPSPDNSEDFV